MDKATFRASVLEALPYKTLEVKKKQFCLMQFGYEGSIWFVHKGMLMTARNTEEGRYKGIGLYDVNAILGIAGIHTPMREIPCYALGESILHYVPTKAFDELMLERADLCHFMMGYISESLLEVYNDLEVSTLGTLEEQILAFEKRLDKMRVPWDASITEVAMSMALGAHPGSVCRARKRLKKTQD